MDVKKVQRDAFREKIEGFSEAETGVVQYLVVHGKTDRATLARAVEEGAEVPYAEALAIVDSATMKGIKQSIIDFDPKNGHSYTVKQQWVEHASKL